MQIKDLAKTRIGHSFRHKLVNDPEGNTKIIQPKNISSTGFLDLKNYPPIQTKIVPNNPLATGEVLFLNKGRFVAAIFNESEQECWTTPGSVIILTLNSTKILPEYLALYLNSSKGRQKLNRVTEFSSIPFITRTNLERIDIPIPSKDKQKNLINLMSTISRYEKLTTRKTNLLKNILNAKLEF